MLIPDLNLLIYAVNRESPLHVRAAKWLQRIMSGDEPVGIPWVVTLGFIRITTNQRVFTKPLGVEQATQLVEDWFSRRGVTSIEPGETHWRILRDLLRESGTGANLTTDAHLAALSIERGATLHTADADFGRFKGLRWINPMIS